MKKTISSIRIDEEVLSKMAQAIKKYNNNSAILQPINQSQFVRLSIGLLAELILKDIAIPVKLNHS